MTASQRRGDWISGVLGYDQQRRRPVRGRIAGGGRRAIVVPVWLALRLLDSSRR